MTPLLFKDTRLRMGYSAKALASAWGMTPGAIYHWEKGRVPIPMVAVMALAYLSTRPRPAKSRLALAAEKYQPGARFGRLVIEGVHASQPVRNGGPRETRASVICDCGTTKDIRASSLATVRQCCGRCPASKDPMPPNAPAPEMTQALDAAIDTFVFPEVAPPPPRIGQSPRAKIKRFDAPPAVRPVEPPPAPVILDYGEDDDILDLDASFEEELRYMERKRREKAEQEEKDALVEADLSEGDDALDEDWEDGL